MAEITYRCNLCGNQITKIIYKKNDYRTFMYCTNEVFTGPKGEEENPDYAHCWQTCNGVLERVPLKAPSSTVMETVDNGLMQKRVHYHQNIKEILHERTKKHKSGK